MNPKDNCAKLDASNSKSSDVIVEYVFFCTNSYKNHYHFPKIIPPVDSPGLGPGPWVPHEF